MIKRLFIAQAIVDVLFGVPLIFFSPVLLSIYGLSTDRVGTYLGEFLGVAFLALAWISWSARDLADGEPRRFIVRAGLLAGVIGTLVNVNFELQPDATPLGWINVAITLVLAIGWGYAAYQSMEAVAARQPA